MHARLSFIPRNSKTRVAYIVHLVVELVEWNEVEYFNVARNWEFLMESIPLYQIFITVIPKMRQKASKSRDLESANTENSIMSTRCRIMRSLTHIGT